MKQDRELTLKLQITLNEIPTWDYPGCGCHGGSVLRCSIPLAE